MERYILPLTSGFIGAILGAAVALWISRANRRVAAVERMLSLVYPIGFKSWWQPEGGKPALIFHENYTELWAAYAALRAALPWWKRKGLDKAWQTYMMMVDYYDQIPDDEYHKVFQKGTHKSREEAVQRSGEFVRYLVQLRSLLSQLGSESE
jgi:hypothetical protein